MSVRQLLASVDSRELAEWFAYFQIEAELIKKAQPQPLPVEQKISTSLTKYKRGKR